MSEGLLIGIIVLIIFCWIFISIVKFLSRKQKETTQVASLYNKYLRAKELWGDFVLIKAQTEYAPIYNIQVVILSQFTAQFIASSNNDKISSDAWDKFQKIILKDLDLSELAFYQKFGSRILQDYEYNFRLYVRSSFTVYPNTIFGSSIGQHLFLNSTDFVTDHSNIEVEMEYFHQFLETVLVIKEGKTAEPVNNARIIPTEKKHAAPDREIDAPPKKNEESTEFQKFTSVEKIFRCITIIAEVLLILALCDKFSYGFYTFLRFVVCTAFIGLIINQRVPPLVKVFTIMGAILYNPIVPVHIGDRDVWCVINVLSIPLFIIGECFVYLNEKKD